MREIVLNGPNHRLWVAMRLQLGASAFPDCFASVGLEEEGRILAAVIYTSYQVFPTTGRSVCWASIAAMPGENWCTRRFVKAIVAYPFEAVGVRVLRTMCARSNMAARKFNEKLGLRYTGRARCGWDGKEDALHYDMLPQDAEKWLGYVPKAWKEHEKRMAG